MIRTNNLAILIVTCTCYLAMMLRDGEMESTAAVTDVTVTHAPT